MPRLRRKATRKRKAVDVSPREFAYFCDDPDYEKFDGNKFSLLGLRGARSEKLEAMWGAVRDEILDTWLIERPGFRPSTWWRLDAPRWDDPWDDCHYHGTFAEPRRRLGGIGTAIYECLNYKPAFDCGVPASFLGVEDHAYYAEHGKNGGLVNHDHPDQPVEAFDPDDPPQYESQARYLWDRDLLEPEEKKAVKELGLLEVVEVVQGEPPPTERQPPGSYGTMNSWVREELRTVEGLGLLESP